MPEWLAEVLHIRVRIDPIAILVRVTAAFTLGCVVAGIYRLTARREHAPGLPGTFVMLSILIALVTIVIGDNMARAFSLAGVLAIIRFRTVMEDTRDSAFVIFAVVCGMASGANYLVEVVLTLPLMFLAAWLFRRRAAATSSRLEQRLVLRLGTGTRAEQQVQAVLQAQLPALRVAGLATARGGAALDVTYAIPPLAGDAALALVAELSRIEGVQGVELKE